MDIETKISNSVSPSWYVRTYDGAPGTFQSVSVCHSCGLRAARRQMHPVNPCPRCGGKVRGDYAGRWIVTTKERLFGLLGKEVGYWQLREEAIEPKKEGE